MKRVIGILWCTLATAASAQTEICHVTSTNHGGGVFSYTFARGNTDYVWGIGNGPFTLPGSGSILLKSLEVVDVQSPPGWTATVTNDLIEWQKANELVYLDDPITFVLRSRLTEGAFYPVQFSDPNGMFGVILGQIFRPPDPVPIHGGFERFAYIGPTYPKLSIAFSSPTVELRWSTNTVGFELQSMATSAPGNVWSSINATPQVMGTNYAVTVPASQSGELFRLRRP